MRLVLIERLRDYGMLRQVAWLIVLVISVAVVYSFEKHRRPEQAVPLNAVPKVVVSAAFDKDCEKAVVREIRKAKSEILLAIYSITRRSITSSLVSASKADVKVRVKYDARQADWEPMAEAIQFLQKNGVECTAIHFADERTAMHNKFMVVDCAVVLTGSFNFTSAGVSNKENVVILESARTASTFREAFNKICGTAKAKP